MEEAVDTSVVTALRWHGSCRLPALLRGERLGEIRFASRARGSDDMEAPDPVMMDDDFSQREDKSTSYTLTLTVLLMAGLMVAAWALKRNAGDHNPAPPPVQTDKGIQPDGVT